MSDSDKGCGVTRVGLFSQTRGSHFQNEVKFQAVISIFKHLKSPNSDGKHERRQVYRMCACIKWTPVAKDNLSS